MVEQSRNQTSLPKACKVELEEISKRNSFIMAITPWKPEEITEKHKLHYFVPGDYCKDKLAKPDKEAFGRPGLSVRAEGGSFQKYSKFRLALDLADFSSQIQKDFVGVVSFEAKILILKFDFNIKHDPFPYNDKGKFKAQARNHVQIICKKQGTGIQIGLLEICEWSLTAVEFEAISQSLSFKLLYPPYRIYKNFCRATMVFFFHVAKSLGHQ